MYREIRPLGNHVQILVGDYRGDLDDLIGLRHQTGHLQIDPDQIVVIRHVASSFQYFGHHSKECRPSESLPPTADCCTSAPMTDAKCLRGSRAVTCRSYAATGCAASSISTMHNLTWLRSNRVATACIAPM